MSIEKTWLCLAAIFFLFGCSGQNTTIGTSPVIPNDGGAELQDGNCPVPTPVPAGASQPLTINWLVNFEFDNSSAVPGNFSELKINIGSRWKIEDGIILLTPLDWNSDSKKESGAVEFSPSQVKYSVVHDTCQVYAPRYNGSASTRVKVKPNSKARVLVEIYSGSRLLDTKFLYVESGSGSVYISDSDFSEPQYEKLLSGLHGSDSGSKKALKADARYGGYYMGETSCGSGKCPKLAPVFGSIEDAVAASGGTYGEINEGFVSEIFENGLANIDSPPGKINFSTADVDGEIFEWMHIPAYRIFGPKETKLKIDMQSDFPYMLTIFADDGSLVSVITETDSGEAILPYTGGYDLEVSSLDRNVGKFSVRIDAIK